MWKSYEREKPKLNEMYIVAWRPKDHDIGMEHFYAMWEFDVEENKFIVEGPAKDVWGKYGTEILAWMDLPEEYKE